MMRNLAGEAHINDLKSPRHYLSVRASSRPDLCKYGKKYDSMLPKKIGAVPTHLTSLKTPVENCNPKEAGTSFQIEDNVSYYSGVNNMTHLQHSHSSGDLSECMSEESVNMKPRTPSPFLKNIITFEQNSSFLEDGSLESTLIVPEEVPLTFNENSVSVDDVPWACSDVSAVMELESPPSALESMVSTLVSLDHNLKGSSNRYRSMKQETMRKSMTSTMASSSKGTASTKPKKQKQVNGLKVDEKQKRELLMLRSSLPVKISLLGRVKVKKKVDAVVELSITNEKSPMGRTVKSVKPRQAGVITDKGSCTSLSPIIIKKKTLSSPKRVQLSPKPTLLLKTNSSVVKYKSSVPDSERITCQSTQESSKIARNAGMSKLGEMKILKQFAASQAPKSAVNYAPGLNNRKLRSVKNQVEVGNVDGVKKKTLHVVEQKLVGVAQKSAEQKHMKLRSQHSSRTLSSSSSISSSTCLSSCYGEVSDGSRLKICDASGSKNTHIGERKGRTPLHVVEQKLVGVALKSAEQNLRSQHTSGTLSSRSSICSSAFGTSGYEEENDGSRLIISVASGSKKTLFSEREGRTSLPVEQKLFGVAVMSAEQKHTKLRSQLSSRTSTSRSLVSSSAFVSSNYEENDESQLILSNTSGSKKTQIGEGNRKTSLYSQKSDYKKLQKRTANVTLEDKSLSFENMSFRRGKEVCPQSEILDQSRLKSMQEKRVSEAENFEGETGMSSFRESRESTSAYSATVSPGSPIVVLRQQDVQEKNTEVLFNNVIEETANKLEEARMSKEIKMNTRKQQELLSRRKIKWHGLLVMNKKRIDELYKQVGMCLPMHCKFKFVSEKLVVEAKGK